MIHHCSGHSERCTDKGRSHIHREVQVIVMQACFELSTGICMHMKVSTRAHVPLYIAQVMYKVGTYVAVVG